MKNKKNSEWTEVNSTSIYTGWPLFQQLAALGCKIELTANAPYPTFIVTYNPSNYWLFNQSGSEVVTMVGTFRAFPFNEVADCRDLLPTED